MCFRFSAKSTTLTIRASQRARSTAADNDRCGLFITRLHANTSEAELNEYVRKVAGCRVRTQKFKTKFNTYSSFYIPLARASWGILLEASILPQGVLIKEFKRYIWIRIISCRGINSAIPLLGKICESNDTILLQETMLAATILI